MKGKLIYDLSDPDDSEKFVVAVKSVDLFLTLLGLDQYLRNKIKYENDFETIEDALRKVRKKLNDLMYDRDVNFNMLS